MEVLEVSTSSVFYGRSIAYDGEFHVVQSSKPPCANLADLDACCETVKYKIRRTHWDHFETGKSCGDSEDDDILKFVPRKGMSLNLAKDFEQFRVRKFTAPIQKNYCLEVSEVSGSAISVNIPTEEQLQIPREAIKEIEFVGVFSEDDGAAAALIEFTSSPIGLITKAFVDDALRRTTLEAELEVHLGGMVSSGNKSIIDVIYSCNGPNCKSMVRGWNYPKWEISRAWITHKNFVRASPLMILDGETGSIIRTTVTPTVSGQRCGLPVTSAYLKATLEYRTLE